MEIPVDSSVYFLYLPVDTLFYVSIVYSSVDGWRVNFLRWRDAAANLILFVSHYN